MSKEQLFSIPGVTSVSESGGQIIVFVNSQEAALSVPSVWEGKSVSVRVSGNIGFLG